MKTRVKSTFQICRQIHSCTLPLAKPTFQHRYLLNHLCAETWSTPSGRFIVIKSIFVFWNLSVSLMPPRPAQPSEGSGKSPGRNKPLVRRWSTPEGPPTAGTVRSDSQWERRWVPTTRAQAAWWAAWSSWWDYRGAPWLGGSGFPALESAGGCSGRAQILTLMHYMMLDNEPGLQEAHLFIKYIITVIGVGQKHYSKFITWHQMLIKIQYNINTICYNVICHYLYISVKIMS